MISAFHMQVLFQNVMYYGIFIKRISTRASRVAQRSMALHLSARGVTTDLGLIPGCVTTGRDRESHKAEHNCPASSRLGESLAGGALVVSSRSGRPGRLTLGVSCTVFPAAGFRVKRAGVKKRGLAGHVSEDA